MVFSKEREPDIEFNKLKSISQLARQEYTGSCSRGTPPTPTIPTQVPDCQVGAGEGKYTQNRSQNDTGGGAGPEWPVSLA